MSMTKEEYFAKKKSLLRALDKEFVKSNNSVKVGDKIEDHIGKGIVNKITVIVSIAERTPQILYRCDNLNKSGKISKRKPMRTILQCNLKK